MTINEAKKAGFKIEGGLYVLVWNIVEGKAVVNCKNVRSLGPSDFPSMAKAVEELKRRKAEASAKRVEALVAARKAAGTQAPPPETPEQRDARLKALYESYCKQGGEIQRNKLTKELLTWMKYYPSKCFYAGSAEEPHDIGAYDFSLFDFATLDVGVPAFWTHADAEHDHFLRTWKGPLTEEAKKKLRKGDAIYYADKEGVVRGPIVLSSDNTVITSKGQYFLHEDEAKTAAHDLRLAEEEKKAAPKLMDDPNYAECVEARDWEGAESRESELAGKAPSSVLDEAKACVCGPRRRDYGTPDENFGRIAEHWNTHLKGKLLKPITTSDVAMMMILLKVAREANSPKRDNYVDIAGYAQCAGELGCNIRDVKGEDK